MNKNHRGFLPVPGRVPLFIVMSSSRAMYGIMASPPSFRISPETQSGPTDLTELLVTPAKIINNWPSLSFKIYTSVAFNCAFPIKSFSFHLLSNN